MNALRQAFLRAVRDGALWEPGQRVALAVSGGADSMVMLDLAARTAPVHGARLTVVSIDHGQHSDSAAFAASVVAEGRMLGVPGEVLHATLPTGCSEAEARSARYALLEGLDVDRVALAHHVRDQAETVLVNLLRGTGPRGLRGMAARRDRFVRPLLGVEHMALQAYVSTHGIRVFEDPSNATDRYLRNRIRHHLLPLLEEIRPGAVNALARSAGRLADDEVLLESLAAELPADPRVLRNAPSPLARRRIEALVGPVTTAQLDAVMRAVQAGQGAVVLDLRRRVVVSGEALHVEDDADLC
ncbi:MAG: tRNA lysidine(34) synthetase TilS [Alphaproteobacteria bacterium]|nr:tRNA lysidine(34) synthetase TilS [Alphaproteobacteria bacterium]